jgi:hypothetical protein
MLYETILEVLAVRREDEVAQHVPTSVVIIKIHPLFLFENGFGGEFADFFLTIFTCKSHT